MPKFCSNGNGGTGFASILNEQWKDVVGFEGLYAVSNQGRIKRIGRCLGGGRSKIGFMIGTKANQICLCKGQSRRVCNVSRLVAEAFLNKPNITNDSIIIVKRKDNNKQNNNANNLMWIICKKRNC